MAGIGSNGLPAPTVSQEVAGVGPDGNLHPLSTDNSGVLNVNAAITFPPGAATAANQVLEIAQLTAINANTTGVATAANQATEIASLASIDSKLTAPLSVTGPLTDVELRASPVPVSGPLTDAELRASAVPVSAASLPLPLGAATSANQATEIASLASIDSKLTSPLAVTGPLTDTQLRAADVGVVVSNFPATQPISAVSLPLPTGASTAANQATANASLSSIDSKLTSPLAVTGPLTDVELRATPVPVSMASTPLPTGAATAANQATEIASLASIDSKLTSPLAVTGPLTDTELRASAVSVSVSNFPGTQPVSGTVAISNFPATQPISAASLPLPTGASTEATLAAFSAKSASSSVTVPFDYQDITYVGATTRINTVVFKSGGSGGTTVATLTMGYDGSNRLTSVTKT